MHDGMQYDPIQGQGQGRALDNREFGHLSNKTAISFPIYNGGWQMTTDS